MKTLVDELLSSVSLSSVSKQTSSLLLSIIMQLRVTHEVNVSPVLTADLRPVHCAQKLL